MKKNKNHQSSLSIINQSSPSGVINIRWKCIHVHKIIEEKLQVARASASLLVPCVELVVKNKQIAQESNQLNFKFLDALSQGSGLGLGLGLGFPNLTTQCYPTVEHNDGKGWSTCGRFEEECQKGLQNLKNMPVIQGEEIMELSK